MQRVHHGHIHPPGHRRRGEARVIMNYVERPAGLSRLVDRVKGCGDVIALVHHWTCECFGHGYLRGWDPSVTGTAGGLVERGGPGDGGGGVAGDVGAGVHDPARVK
jgi:hypothetical protein